MRHSMSKDTAFNGETTPRHTILYSDSQCLPPGDPKILCAKHEYPVTGKSFILVNYIVKEFSTRVRKFIAISHVHDNKKEKTNPKTFSCQYCLQKKKTN